MNSLTSGEREIVLALAERLSKKTLVAGLTGIVKDHLHNIYTKLGVKNRTALAVLAHTEFTSDRPNLYESLPTHTDPPLWLMSPSSSC
jgi:DNA-binding NarL/FixJ family response regulator